MRTVLASLLACMFLLSAAQSARAESISAEELRPALERLLKEHPEVLLNFLRDHSEEVLDIAQLGSDRKRLSSLERQWANDARSDNLKKVRLKDRPRIGDEKAKVTIVAFSDFTCNYCLRAEKTLEALLDEYRGRVSFVFKNYPLDPEGISGLASQYYVAISMQSEELAWKYYRELFANSAELMARGEEFLRATAQKIGVDMRAMDSLRRQKKVATILKEDQEDADRLKVEGTPYFLVNNLVIRGAIPLNMFRRAIEIELAR